MHHLIIQLPILVLCVTSQLSAQQKTTDERSVAEPSKTKKSSTSKPSSEEKKKVKLEKAEPKVTEISITNTATLKPEDLIDFSKLPAKTQAMLRDALELTSRSLGYKYGSYQPETGGMDCSGFVYHILQKNGFAGVPRQSNEMYAWVWRAKKFYAFNGVTAKSFELENLRPGHLLFWTNTTTDEKTDRDPPITHVMIYLGKRKSDDSPIVVGSSEGRTYDGQKMFGVSIFDFRIPSVESQSRFIGYAELP